MPKQAVPADWDMAALSEALARDFGTRIDPKAWLAAEPELEEQKLRERVVQAVLETYDAKVTRVGAPVMRHIEKQTMLQKLDQHWREHLGAMEYLKQGIHLRGYAQKDYRYEFKREAFELFAAMLERVKLETASFMATCQVRTQEELEREEEERRQRLMRALQAQHAEAASLLAGAEEPAGKLLRRRRRRRCPGTGARRAGAPQPLPDSASAGTFVRNERKVGTQRAVPVRLGQEVQALPRRALERRVTRRSFSAGARIERPHILVVAAALYDARGTHPDRRAPRWKAHGRPLGVPRRQGRRGRSPRLQALGARAARGTRHRGRGRADLHAPAARLPGPQRRAVAVGDRALRRHAPQGLDGQRLKWVSPPALAGEDILEADRPFIEALESLPPP